MQLLLPQLGLPSLQACPPHIAGIPAHQRGVVRAELRHLGQQLVVLLGEGASGAIGNVSAGLGRCDARLHGVELPRLLDELCVDGPGLPLHVHREVLLERDQLRLELLALALQLASRLETLLTLASLSAR